jgi:hypothetical protein
MLQREQGDCPNGAGRGRGGHGPCLFFCADRSVVCVLRMAGLRKCHLTKSVNLPYLNPMERLI